MFRKEDLVVANSKKWICIKTMAIDNSSILHAMDSILANVNELRSSRGVFILLFGSYITKYDWRIIKTVIGIGSDDDDDEDDVFF